MNTQLKTKTIYSEYDVLVIPIDGKRVEYTLHVPLNNDLHFMCESMFSGMERVWSYGRITSYDFALNGVIAYSDKAKVIFSMPGIQLVTNKAKSNLKEE